MRSIILNPLLWYDWYFILLYKDLVNNNNNNNNNNNTKNKNKNRHMKTKQTKTRDMFMKLHSSVINAQTTKLA